MAHTEVAIRRPERWDVPFGEKPMTDEEIDRLLLVEPFRSIDPSSFSPSMPLREILRHDCRVVRYGAGDVIVREGDYGSSAFLILRGRVRVVLSGLAPELVGRDAGEKLGWWRTLGRVLGRSKHAEVRQLDAYNSCPAKVATTAGMAADVARPIDGLDRRGRGRQASSKLHIFLQDIPRVLAGANTVTLEAGEIFGELAAMTRSPRAATVLAEDDAALVEIRWQGLRELMRAAESLRLHVERLYRENSLRVHLRETPLLAELPPERLQAVADATAFETHGQFEWTNAYEMAVRRQPGDAIVDEPLIAEEGMPADGLVLIRAGFARESCRYGHGHRTLAYLGRGQAFGIGEAIEASACGKPAAWSTSLRALGYVDVLRIPQAALEEFVFPFVPPEALARLAAERARVRSPLWQKEGRADESVNKANGSIRPGTAGVDHVEQGLFDFLVDRRLINGTQAMAIDLDRCTRCDDCVRACAATHDNNPRFNRGGVRHDSLLIAHACMHCIDPVCMIGCPTGAIGRDHVTGVVRINDRTCVGCGVCSQSCPYDNIQLVEIRDRRGAVAVDAATAQPIAKATKCDLCVDLKGGPACQRACPHDALVRINLGDLEQVSAWSNR